MSPDELVELQREQDRSEFLRLLKGIAIGGMFGLLLWLISFEILFWR